MNFQMMFTIAKKMKMNPQRKLFVLKFRDFIILFYHQLNKLDRSFSNTLSNYFGEVGMQANLWKQKGATQFRGH